MTNAKWIKQNNVWKIRNNDITLLDFNQNFKTLDNTIETSNGKSVVYIPTHNLNDVYEWFRLFQDSHIYTDNVDKNGFIQAYYNKQTAESKGGYFENIVKVKASSTNNVKYFNTGANYFRSSIDYITNFTNIDQLFIDNVEIFSNETVLLKNQNYQQLSLFDIDNTTDNKYQIIITPDESNQFKNGDNIIIKDINNNFISDKIISVVYQYVGLDLYAIITPSNAIVTDYQKIASIDNGEWSDISHDDQNGLYIYQNNQLTLLDLMYDIDKTYNQIVFVYQGETNSNKQFYLRRTENIASSNYSLFPISGTTDPLNYSQGKAALIRAEFDYNLSIDGTVNINPDIAGCCSCIANAVSNNVSHPLGNAPFNDLDSDPFRILYLDNTVAEKVFATDQYGIGSYTMNDISLDNCDKTLIFKRTDIDNNDNVIVNMLSDRFTTFNLYSTYITYVALASNQTLSNSFGSSQISITNNYTTNTSIYTLTYGLSDDIFPNLTNTVGACVKLTFNFTKDSVTYKAFENTFIIRTVILTGTDCTIQLNPALDINFYNEMLSMDDYSIDVELIGYYGSKSASVNDNYLSLKSSLEKSLVSEFYNFDLINDGTVKLRFNNIKQNIDYKWVNFGCAIRYNSVDYFLQHTIDTKYRQYFYNYNINQYLNDYLGINTNTELPLAALSITYQDNSILSSYFQIIGSIDGGLYGTTVKFGSDYKNDIINNILPNTEVTFDADVVWINSVEWDDVLNVGTIITQNIITIPNNGDTINITPTIILSDISDRLQTILTQQFNTEGPYKVDSYSYANLLTKYNNLNGNKSNLISRSLSTIIYKQNNQTKINFTKRDRFFKFDNDVLHTAEILADTDIDISSAPAIIDGYNLNQYDKIVLSNQTDPTENGIYIFDSIGSALVRYTDYNLNDYWRIINGTYLDLDIQLKYNTPVVYGTSNISVVFNTYNNKKDPRLTLKPISYTLLGDNNLTNNLIDINIKYDILETTENLVTVGKDINTSTKIRFIDGLTEDNILQNIYNQGQYAWILRDDVITENAVVGKDSNGVLIWYTGIWKSGTWCNGIWYNGIWESGIWVNGTMHSRNIQDNYYSISVSTVSDLLSTTWITGTWLNGTRTGGTMNYVTWNNGTNSGGTIIDGTWANGTMTDGVINHIIWSDGTLNGGEIQTGIWENGTVEQLDNSIAAKVGTNAKITSNFSDRFIWRSGNIIKGDFYAGDGLDHSASIFYAGTFRSGNFYAGTFIFGSFLSPSIFHNGLWIGGYKCSITDLSTTIKTITIDPSVYDLALGLTTITGYIANTKHNNKNTSYYLLATPTTNTSFAIAAFLNIYEQTYNLTYNKKLIIPNSTTDTTILLDITSELASSTSYVAGNISTNTIDGNPFICSEFTGTFKNGLWLNGVMVSGSFENGVFVDGYIISGTIGQ